RFALSDTRRPQQRVFPALQSLSSQRLSSKTGHSGHPQRSPVSQRITNAQGMVPAVQRNHRRPDRSALQLHFHAWTNGSLGPMESQNICHSEGSETRSGQSYPDLSFGYPIFFER